MSLLSSLNPLGALGMLRDTARGGRDPVPMANAYLQEIPRHGREAYSPFIEQGKTAQSVLGPEYARLLSNRPDYSQMGANPVGYLNQLLGQYEPSAGYQYRKNKLAGEAAANAAAGGFRGTRGDTQRQLELINALMGDDMQQFLANVLGIQQYGQSGQERQHGAGLAGYEKMADRGFGASGALADYLGGNLGQQAGLHYQGQNQRNVNQAAFMNNALQAGAQLAGAGAGGGAGGGGAFQSLQGIGYNANRGGYGAAGGRPYGAS